MSDAFAPGLLDRLEGPMRRVLVLRASRIGDLVCAEPALRALRAALPAAELTLLTLPLLRELAERSPHVDRFRAFPGYPGLAEQLFEPRAALACLAALQRERYDLAVQLQGSGVYTNPFTLLVGARATAGYVRPGDRPGLLDAALPLPSLGHEADRALALATFLGAPARGRVPELHLRAEDHAAAERLLSDVEPPLVALHPGARNAARAWDPARFGAVGCALRRRLGGTILLLGDDEARPAAVAAGRAAGGPLLDLVGRVGLGALGAVLLRAALVVTNDSGPAHLAYALGVPTVTVMGAGDLERYGPAGPGPFRVLTRPAPARVDEDTDRGLDGIDVDEVLAAAEALLAPPAAARARACP